MKTATYILTLIIILFSCKSEDRRYYAFTDYDYEVRSYYNGPYNAKNFIGSNFYRNDTLIRMIVSKRGCTEYFYDSTGLLLETRLSRNCTCGIRNILIYDSLNNHIGYFSTNDSIINLDTVKIDTIFFYDNQKRLIKERTNKRENLKGEKFEIWKHYKYLNNKIYREITLRNADTIWDGRYYYDSRGTLIKIHRVRESVYETEFFKYNPEGLLIQEEIVSTENPITPEVSYSAGNNRRTFQYDSKGFLTNEILYNHKGKVISKIVYLKIYRNINAP